MCGLGLAPSFFIEPIPTPHPHSPPPPPHFSSLPLIEKERKKKKEEIEIAHQYVIDPFAGAQDPIPQESLKLRPGSFFNIIQNLEKKKKIIITHNVIRD